MTCGFSGVSLTMGIVKDQEPSRATKFDLGSERLKARGREKFRCNWRLRGGENIRADGGNCLSVTVLSMRGKRRENHRARDWKELCVV